MRPRRPKVGPPTVQSVHLPAPLGGLNTVDPASAMPASDCPYAWNVIAGELGLESRPGYAEWCTGLTGGVAGEVRTVLDFKGSSRSKDKRFACTPDGIWDVTSSSAAPSLVLAFATQSGDAGYGVGRVVANANGDHFLVYTDEANGYHVYTESTGAWAAVAEGAGAGEVEGVDPRTFVHVTAHKNRLWFTARDSSSAWYLDVNALFGTATAFPLGAQFKAGGGLRGLWSWTYDGGAGADDLLVAISGGGDVVIYQGTDPSAAASWGLKGVWSVGAVPAGRRIATDSGGDLLVLSRSRLEPLSRLVVGAEETKRNIARKISNLLQALATSYGDLAGWSIFVHPALNALVITVPTEAGAETQQLVLALANGSWWRWRGLPILSAAGSGKELYFGTADGRICRNVGDVDNVLLSDSTSFTAVGWSVLTAYQNLRTARQKQIQMLRPSVLAGVENASVQASARYRFNMDEPAAPSGNGGGGSNSWGTGRWGTAKWGGAHAVTQPMQGASGLARELAIAVRGNAIARTTLVGIDVMFSQGGLL